MRVLPLVAQSALLVAFILSAVAVNLDWVQTAAGNGSLWQAPEGGSWFSFEVEEVGGATMVQGSVFVVLAAATLTFAAALLGFVRSPVPMGLAAVVASLATLAGTVLHRAAVERHLSGLDAEPLHGMVLSWVSAGVALLAGVLALQSHVLTRDAGRAGSSDVGPDAVVVDAADAS